jgi:DNA (cytosine-5)-methyltransferase 1
MDVLTTSLEDLGYRWAYRVVDSRSFGVPQRRRRVYLVATLEGDPRAVLFADESVEDVQDVPTGTVAYGFYWTEGLRGLGWAVDSVPTLKGGSTIGIPSAPAILLPDGPVVVPDIRDAERLQGFPPGWTRPAERAARPGVRWKLVGNAVTVPAATWVGRRLARPGRVRASVLAPIASGRRWPTAAWNVGDGRWEVSASEWPVRRARRSLESFLRYRVRPLSARATAGFLGRAERAKLRFPTGFLAAMRRHLQVLQRDT